MRLAFVLCLAVAAAACAAPRPIPTTAAGTPDAPSADAPLPDTPAGRFFAEWLRMMNAGTADELRRFYSTRYAHPAAGKELDDRVAFVQRLRAEDGLRHLRAVEISSDWEIAVVMQAEGTETWLRQHVRLDAQPPHLVIDSGGGPVERPDGLGERGALDDATIAAKLDAYVDKLAARELFSGSVAVARGDRVVYQRAAGLSSRAWGVRNEIDTKFNLGSMNKMFTSVAIAQLAQQGKLSYDDTLAKLWPDYPNQEVARKITVRQLLTHTSGLGDYFTEEYERTSKDRLRAIKDYLPLFVDKPLLFEPGARFEYSNAGFMVLGGIVEKVSGQDYFAYVREHVYAPAGMKDTDAFEMDHDTPKLAIGYTRDPAGAWMNNLYLHVVKGGPAGGGFSTVPDLLRFARALANGTLVDGAHLATMTSKQVETPFGAYGYGFGVTQRQGHPSYGHNGGFAGINGSLVVLPDLGVTVAALANLDPPAAERLALRAVDLVTQR